MFLLSGLWHGANWTFIIWGAVHGLVVILERLTNFSKTRFSNYFGMAYTFILVSILWVFFRAENIAQAFDILANAIHFPKTGLGIQFRGLGLNATDLILAGVFAGLMITHDILVNKTNVYEWIQKRNTALRWSIYNVLVIIVVFYSVNDGTKNFIYFQFEMKKFIVRLTVFSLPFVAWFSLVA